MGAATFSVYGCFETRERFAAVYQARNAREAEDSARDEARERGATLWVCRVVPGEHAAADTYTAFIDPADPRNNDIDGLTPDMGDLTAGDPEWTVFGLAMPRHTPPDRKISRTAERYGDVVNAASAGAAEDVARARLADRHGQLWVCAVLPGCVTAADTYAAFADPDVKAA